MQLFGAALRPEQGREDEEWVGWAGQTECMAHPLPPYNEGKCTCLTTGKEDG